MHALLHSVPLTLQQATTDPHLCWRLLDTHGQVWVSRLWGHCSFLLGPGVHKVLFVPSKTVSPILCKFWQLYGGVNCNLLQKDLGHTQVCCTQSPCPCSRPQLTRTSAGDIHTKFWFSLCGVSFVLVHTRFVWAIWASLEGMVFESKCDFTPPNILLRLILCLWTWGIFLWWDPTFSCWWLFRSKLQLCSSHRGGCMPVLLLCHLVSSINGLGNMIQMMWGIPHESGIQKAHTRSLAQYSQTRLQRCRLGVVLPVDAKKQ